VGTDGVVVTLLSTTLRYVETTTTLVEITMASTVMKTKTAAELRMMGDALIVKRRDILVQTALSLQNLARASTVVKRGIYISSKLRRVDLTIKQTFQGSLSRAAETPCLFSLRR